MLPNEIVSLCGICVIVSGLGFGLAGYLIGRLVDPQTHAVDPQTHNEHRRLRWLESNVYQLWDEVRYLKGDDTADTDIGTSIDDTDIECD